MSLVLQGEIEVPILETLESISEIDKSTLVGYITNLKYNLNNSQISLQKSKINNGYLISLFK